MNLGEFAGSVRESGADRWRKSSGEASLGSEEFATFCPPEQPIEAAPQAYLPQLLHIKRSSRAPGSVVGVVVIHGIVMIQAKDDPRTVSNWLPRPPPGLDR